MSTVSAIIVAAGKSSRYQSANRSDWGAACSSRENDPSETRCADTTVKKPFVSLEGRPVWYHSAQRFFQHPDVRQLILVVAEEDLAWVSEELKRQQESQRVQVVTGGMERANSVENALKYVDSQHHYVAIHDAARPCISVALIDRVLSQARISGAAIPVVTIHSTVKQSSDGRFVHRTLDRSQLFLAQTPQVFRRDWIVEAYSKQVCQVTDEAQLLEQLGYPVAMVEGSATNLKLTVPEDLLLAELFVRQFHQ